jgi:proteasome lid subunit RPN8/RPN11
MGMRLEISIATREAILDAAAGSRVEVCGLLLGVRCSHTRRRPGLVPGSTRRPAPTQEVQASDVRPGGPRHGGRGDDGEVASVTCILPARNVAADPVRFFEIDPAVLLAAHRAGRHGGAQVIGHYHSHPNGRAEPSPRDAAYAAPDGAFWLIAAAGRLTAWRAVPAGALHGRFDAVALTCHESPGPSQGARPA